MRVCVVHGEGGYVAAVGARWGWGKGDASCCLHLQHKLVSGLHVPAALHVFLHSHETVLSLDYCISCPDNSELI